jgi:predicted lipoprotein
MRAFLFLMTIVAAAPASGNVGDAVSRFILPALSTFSEASAELDAAAQADCRAESLHPAYQAAFDAWMAISDLRIGPSETAALSIAFWPDDRGFTARTLSGLIAAEDPIAKDPASYGDVSIAARGFFALEMLLYDPDFSGYGPDDYACDSVKAIAADLYRQATELQSAWADEFAAVLTSAGDPGNATYLSEDEAIRALYTQLLSSLEFTADTRLGRPMGTFERPRPRQAEAWRSGRSLRNVVLAVEADQRLAHELVDVGLPQTDAAVDSVLSAAEHIVDPAFQDVEDPQARLRVEVLQQAVRATLGAIEIEIGTALGLAPGFNSQDGD